MEGWQHSPRLALKLSKMAPVLDQLLLEALDRIDTPPRQLCVARSFHHHSLTKRQRCHIIQFAAVITPLYRHIDRVIVSDLIKSLLPRHRLVVL